MKSWIPILKVYLHRVKNELTANVCEAKSHEIKYINYFNHK